MPSYIDDDYLVVDGTLILYTGKHVERLVIPCTINNQTITKIGRGAFRDCAYLKYVTLPDSVIRIESCAFCGCSALEEIALPVFSKELTIASDAFAICKNIKRILATLSEYDYQNLYGSSHRLGDGTAIVLNNQNIKTVLAAISKYVEMIPQNADLLFCVQNNDITGLSERLRVLGLELSTTISEEEAFLCCIAKNKYNKEKRMSSEEETKIDWHIRGNKPVAYNLTNLVWFHPNELMRFGGKVHIRMYVSNGYHFVQSAAPVAYKGKEYYVYRRHYLTTWVEGEPLARRDVAVFDKDGLVTDQAAAKEIYAKYNLLALL